MGEEWQSCTGAVGEGSGRVLELLNTEFESRNICSVVTVVPRGYVFTIRRPSAGMLRVFTLDKMPRLNLPAYRRRELLKRSLSSRWGRNMGVLEFYNEVMDIGSTWVSAQHRRTKAYYQRYKVNYWQKIRPRVVDMILTDSFFRFSGGAGNVQEDTV